MTDGLPYWTSYTIFHYSRRQIRWLIQNEALFKAGTWPPEPRGEYITDIWDKHDHKWEDCYKQGSSYVEKLGKSPAQSEAPFCKTIEIYADVMGRIEACGKDGRLLLAQLRAEYDYLDDDAVSALSYTSGAKRKETPYVDWLRIRQTRNSAKNDTPSVTSSLTGLRTTS